VKGMNELKVRAYDKRRGWMALVRSITFMVDGGIANVGLWDLNGGVYDEGASELELMLWTGQKDNHGRDIYEGDIIRRYTWQGDIEWGGVYWDNEEAMFRLERFMTTDEYGQYQHIQSPSEYFDDCEVIGVVYDYPGVRRINDW